MINLYIDPSVMTYALQFTVGAVITVGAVALVVVRKLKKKVKNTLNIEEKKEVEEDIIDLSQNDDSNKND